MSVTWAFLSRNECDFLSRNCSFLGPWKGSHYESEASFQSSIFPLFPGGRAQFEGDTLACDLILDGKCPSPPFKGTDVSVGISEDEFEEYVTFGSLNAGGSMCVLCHP